MRFYVDEPHFSIFYFGNLYLNRTVCQMIDFLFMFIILTYQYNAPDIAGSQKP